MNRWKYVTDDNGEQMPTIIPQQGTPAHVTAITEQAHKGRGGGPLRRVSSIDLDRLYREVFGGERGEQ